MSGSRGGGSCSSGNQAEQRDVFAFEFETIRAKFAFIEDQLHGALMFIIKTSLMLTRWREKQTGEADEDEGEEDETTQWSKISVFESKIAVNPSTQNVTGDGAAYSQSPQHHTVIKTPLVEILVKKRKVEEWKTIVMLEEHTLCVPDLLISFQTFEEG